MKRLVCLLVFLVAGAAWAQTRPAELKQLDAFNGKWSCKGIVYAGDWGPEHPIVFTVDGKWRYGNYWLAVDYDETKTKKSPMPLKGLALYGYDTGLKKFVSGWVDNMNMYQTAQSDGWKGDTMVFEGPAHGSMTGTAKDTFVKKGSKQIDHVFELDGKKIESDTCKKK